MCEKFAKGKIQENQKSTVLLLSFAEQYEKTFTAETLSRGALIGALIGILFYSSLKCIVLHFQGVKK